jgi:protein TonB
MTTTTKDSVEANNLSKQGTQSQDSPGKTAEGGRSNPVCLELSVTIRSLPTENGGLTKPIRIEGRTVIVFDNGAVLRCTENLPIGQSFILSNPNGRDVVCIVVGGRNLPSVKGYVEVQFMEPGNDFWGIRDSAPPPAVAAKAPEVRRDPAPTPAQRVDVPAKNPNMQAGNAPSFDDIGGLLSSPTVPVAPERKASPAPPPSERAASNVSTYSQSGSSTAGLVANLTSSEADQQEEKNAKQAVAEALSNALASGPMAASSPETIPVPNSNAFARKGLMAYDQGDSKSAALSGRMPMIGGAIALVLVGVGVGAFIMNRGSGPAPTPVAATSAVSQPAATPSATESSKPAPATESAAGSTADNGQLPAQNIAVEQNNGVNPVAAIPAVVSNPVSSEPKMDKKESRRSESTGNSRAQVADAAPRRPSMANLKMSSPSAPGRNPADLGAGTAPLTDMVAAQPAGAGAGLLTASSRTSTQPAPPPGTVPPFPVPEAVQAPSVKPVAPKLISSVHLSYPQSAKQTGIQGTVTVLANVDANGVVSSAKALNGPLLLRQSAVDSVKQWKYSPGLADGHPVASQVTVGVEFKLN